jgi:hypothetical protein
MAAMVVAVPVVRLTTATAGLHAKNITACAQCDSVNAIAAVSALR